LVETRSDPCAELRLSAHSILHTPRTGYTLLELVLVLALLVVIAAMIYPSAEGMYGHLRLSQGADAVRGAWAAARSHAIDEGRPYRFAIIPNQGNFRVAPDSSEFWGSNGQAQSSTDSPDPAFILSETLPKGLRFAAGDAAPAAGVQGQSSLPPGAINPEMWSSRTVFLPDGTASQSVEIVFGANGTMGLVLKLRDLTGAVTVRPRKLP
jgi:prepilin-type N-terminal cleavage/methylation domain-containing protein